MVRAACHLFMLPAPLSRPKQPILKEQAAPPSRGAKNIMPFNNEAENLAALCQRCHILHDKTEHLRRRRLTYLARRAIRDMFNGPYG